ncbi:hypothetical protein [Tessaracoccus sp. G1721]
MPDTHSAPTVAPRPEPAALHAYRAIVWAAVLVALIVLVRQPFPALPEAPDQTRTAALPDFVGDFNGAASLKQLREYTADSAPKQQVVNGWYTNDMLEIIGRQNDSLLLGQAQLLESQAAATASAYELGRWQITDRRVESLLVILGFGVAAHVAGSSLILLLARRTRRTPGGEPDDGAGPAEPELAAAATDQPFDPRPHG